MTTPLPRVACAGCATSTVDCRCAGVASRHATRDNVRTTPPWSLRDCTRVLALLLALCSPAHAWQALPYHLKQGLQAGDTHMGVRLLGALQLPHTRIDGIELVEVSALGYDQDADILYLLTDQSGLFQARLDVRDGALAGIELLAAHALHGRDGAPLRGRAADSEGLSLLLARNGRADDTRLLISFERDARVAEYQPDGLLLKERGLPPGLDPRRFASINRGPEAIAIGADGLYRIAPERPLHGDPADHIALFAEDGRRWSYPLASSHSALVAMETLDDGRMLVLERDFERLVYRLVTRLRMATGFEHEGGTLEVRDIANFDNREGWRVDNFEGLTRLSGKRYLMISDDNESVLQRTLLVMFELIDGADAASPKYERVQEAGR